MKYAFRCNKCGRLHTSEEAAEAAHPGSCRVCGAGVKFEPNGTKTLDKDNWEILADAKPKRLTELGLSKDQVEQHKQWVRKVNSDPERNVSVSVEDGPGTEDGSE